MSPVLVAQPVAPSQGSSGARHLFPGITVIAGIAYGATAQVAQAAGAAVGDSAASAGAREVFS